MELTYFNKDKFTITTIDNLTKLDTPNLSKHTILNDTIYGTKNIKIYYSFQGGYKNYKNYNDMNYYAIYNSKLYYINVKTKTKNERTTLLEKWVEEIKNENYQDILIMKEKKKFKRPTKLGNLEDMPF